LQGVLTSPFWSSLEQRRQASKGTNHKIIRHYTLSGSPIRPHNRFYHRRHHLPYDQCSAKPLTTRGPGIPWHGAGPTGSPDIDTCGLISGGQRRGWRIFLEIVFPITTARCFDKYCRAVFIISLVCYWPVCWLPFNQIFVDRRNTIWYGRSRCLRSL